MLPAVLGGAAVVGALASAGVGYLNYKEQKTQNDYNKNLQKIMMDREDNSIQRRIADMEAAGLSPTLAAGNGASAGPVVNTSAPQLDLGNENPAMQALAAMRQEQDITKTAEEIKAIKMQANKAESEKKLLDTTNAIKSHDYDILERTGVLSTVSGEVAAGVNISGAAGKIIKKIVDYSPKNDRTPNNNSGTVIPKNEQHKKLLIELQKNGL